MTDRLSLVICTLNRSNIIRQTIEDLWKLSTQPDELVIIDQTENLPQELDQFYLENKHRLKLIRMKAQGLGQARNRAIAEVNNEIILFIDDDVRLEADIVLHHRKHFSDLKVGAVVGRIDDAHGEPATCGGRVNWFGGVRVNTNTTKVCSVESLSGGNMSIRMSVLRGVGGFWELKGNSVQLREETDVSLRIRKAGYLVLCDPEAALLHLAVRGGSGTWTQTNRIKWYGDYFFAEYSYFFRNFPKWKLPFYILNLMRPILACGLYYGHLRPSAIAAPWQALVRAWQ